MNRVLMAFLLCAGCGQSDMTAMDGGTTTPKLADAATVAAVSSDEKFLAYYTMNGLLSNGQSTGTLSVLPLPSGKAIQLDTNAFGGSFGRTGETLYYETGQTASTDMNSKAIYGTLHLWTPALSLPVKLSKGLVTTAAAPPDGSFILFGDSPMPSANAPVTVVLARAADCSANACKPITLDDGSAVTGMAASLDGRFAAYVKRTGMGIQTKYEVWLVNVAAGTAAKVSESASLLGSAPIAFSPDGSLLATITQTGPIAFQQLSVIATATGMPTQWSTSGFPMGSGVTELAWSDSQTLFVDVATFRGDQGVFRTSAGAAAKFLPPVRAFFIEQSPPGANRYLFAITSGNAGSFNLQLYDLQGQNPNPISIAMSTGTPPLFSDDGKYIAFLEAYDANARTGTLTTSSLPGGALNTIASGVSLYQYGFASGGSKLLFIDKPDAMGGGALTEWNGVAPGKVVEKGVFSFRAPASDHAYVSVTEPDPTAMPLKTAGIYKELLP